MRRWFRHLQGVGCRVMLLAVAAAAAGTSARAANDSSIVVRGRIVDGSGAALEGARIALLATGTDWQRENAWSEGDGPEAIALARTTDDGGFVVRVPVAGQYLLRVGAAGRRTMDVDLQQVVESRTLAAVELPAEDEVTVRVVDATGAAIEGARVLIEQPELARRRNRDRQRATPSPVRAQTDAAGAARLFLAREEQPPAARGTEVTVEVVGAGFVPRREVVSLSALNGLRIELERGVPQRLRVLGIGGEATPGVMIRRSGMRLAAAWTEAGGAVTVRTPSGKPGRFEALAAPGGGRQRVVVSPPPLAGGSQQRAVQVRLEGRNLGARVLDDLGRPIAGALVWATGQGSVLTDASGRARLGTWWGPGSSAERQGLNALAAGHLRNSAVAVEPLAETELELRLERTWSAVLQLRDSEGAPVGGAEVIAHRAGDPWGRGRGDLRSSSGRDGNVELFGLQRSSGYVAVVRASGFVPREVEVARPAQPAMDARVGQAAASPAARVDVIMERARSFVGWVEDEAGAPVVGAWIEIQPQAGQNARSWIAFRGVPPTEVWSGENGQFEVSELAWGTYDFVARAPGFAAARIRGVELRSDAARELGTVVLAPGLRLLGKVLDSAGDPIAGATVEAVEGGSVRRSGGSVAPGTPTTTSAEDGSFEVTDLAPLQYLIQVSAPGWAAVGVPVEMPTEEQIEVRTDRTVQLSGRVVDGAGEPIEGVRLAIHPRRTSEQRSFLWSRARATSDAEGRLQLGDVVPQEYGASIQPPPGWVAPDLPQLKVTSRPPGITGWPRGDEGAFELVLERGVALSGSVRLASGEPAAGASLRTTYGTGFSFKQGPAAQVDPQGRYRLEGVRPGEVEVNLRHPEATHLSETVEIPQGGGVHDFVMQAGYRIAGRVVAATGEPVPNAAVVLVVAGGRISSFGLTGPTSGADGRFELTGKTAGEYVLLASHDSFASGTSEPFVLEADLDGVEVVLGKGGTVEGAVLGVEGDRVAQVVVEASALATATRSATGFGLRAQPGFDGSFRFEHVPPGRWLLTAREPFEHREVSVEVDVASGATSEQTLEFGEGLLLTGTVLRQEEPVVNHQVRLEHRERNRSSRATTDVGGRFRFGGVAAGVVDLVVEVNGLVLLEREVLLEADRDVTLSLGSVVLSGTVVDEQGQPVSSASVRAAVEGGSAPKTWGGVATTDAEGRWRFDSISAGRHVVTAEAEGYSSAQEFVDVPETGEVEARLVLRKGNVLRLRPVSVRATPLDYVQVRRVVGDRVTDWQPVRLTDGIAEVRRAPPGPQSWLVTDREIWVELTLDELPEEPVTVQLPKTVPVVVEVPELVRGGLRGFVRFIDSRGVALIASLSGQRIQREQPLRGHSLQRSLPVGRWTIEAWSADGSFRAAQEFEVSEPGQRLLVEP